MDEQLTVELIPAKPRRGFQPGHPKFGGRRKGSFGIRSANARAVAEKLRICPLELLLRAAATGELPNADGSKTRISPEARINAARSCVPFLYARRSYVSGHLEHDVQTREVPALEHIMRDPELAAAADRIAFAMLDAPDAEYEAIR